MYEDEDRAGIDLGGRARGSLSRHHSLSSGGAIFHLSVTRSSRAKGHSARAAAAYIQREAEYSRERGDELVYAESGHMPGWAEAEPMIYWAAADVHERANGRLCNRLEMALPLALSAAERQELAVGFAHQLTDAERLPYTLAIHAGAGHNPHCHLLISERGNDGLERSPELWFKRYNADEPELGGAEKSTAQRGKEWLVETREAWAAQTNLALELAGHAVRIDHRSLEAQGIERVPMMKLGRAVYEMEARGLETDRGNEARERARANAERARAREQEAEDKQEAEHERAGSRSESGVSQGVSDRAESRAAEQRGSAGRGEEAERDMGGGDTGMEGGGGKSARPTPGRRRELDADGGEVGAPDPAPRDRERAVGVGLEPEGVETDAADGDGGRGPRGGGLFRDRAGQGAEAGEREAEAGGSGLQTAVVEESDRGTTRADSEPGGQAGGVEQEEAADVAELKALLATMRAEREQEEASQAELARRRAAEEAQKREQAAARKRERDKGWDREL